MGIFITLRYVGFIVIFVGLMVAIFIKKLQNYFSNLITSFLSFFKGIGQDFYKEIREDKIHFLSFIIIIIVAILIRLFFLNQPIRYDEAVTFIDYVKKPLFLGLSDYHFTNNHIFYTFLAHITYILFGNQLWAIRLPALIIGILLISMTYVVGRIYYDKYTALLSSSIVASSSILIEYSVLARGYTLVCFFFMAILALVKYLKDNRNSFAWLLFAILSALGFYSIPIMLYPFGVVVVWLLLSAVVKDAKFRRSYLVKYFFIFLIITIILTSILYIPPFIRTGIKSIVASKVIRPQTWSLFIESFKSSAFSIWNQWNRDIPIIISIIIIIGFITSLIFHKKITQYKIPVIVAVFVWCIPLIIIQRTMTYERVWLFLLPLYIVLSSAGIVFLLKKTMFKIKKYWYLIFSVIAFILSIGLSSMVFNSQSVYYSKETGAFIEAEEITVILKEQLKPGDRVLGRAPTDYTLIYYFDKHNVPIDYLYYDLQTSNRAFIIVNKSYEQTIEIVLDYFDLSLKGYSSPKLFLKYDSIYIYKAYNLN